MSRARYQGGPVYRATMAFLATAIADAKARPQNSSPPVELHDQAYNPAAAVIANERRQQLANAGAFELAQGLSLVIQRRAFFDSTTPVSIGTRSDLFGTTTTAGQTITCGTTIAQEMACAALVPQSFQNDFKGPADVRHCTMKGTIDTGAGVFARWDGVSCVALVRTAATTWEIRLQSANAHTVLATSTGFAISSPPRLDVVGDSAYVVGNNLSAFLSFAGLAAAGVPAVGATGVMMAAAGQRVQNLVYTERPATGSTGVRYDYSGLLP